MVVKKNFVKEKIQLIRIFSEFGQIYFGELKKMKIRGIYEKVLEKNLISIV